MLLIVKKNLYFFRCRTTAYDVALPTTSLIICFHNEGRSALLRTIVRYETRIFFIKNTLLIHRCMHIHHSMHFSETRKEPISKCTCLWMSLCVWVWVNSFSSVLNNSPSNLLIEIIMVDDFSDDRELLLLLLLEHFYSAIHLQ